MTTRTKTPTKRELNTAARRARLRIESAGLASLALIDETVAALGFDPLA